MVRAVIGLGSNLGTRRAWLRAGKVLLASAPGMHVVTASRVFASIAVGPAQPDFLNAALLLETELTPEALLGRVLEVEARLGRVRGERWGPRTIDLDVLWMEGVTRSTPALTLPHAELSRRPFALAPLLELVELPEARAALDSLGGAPALDGALALGTEVLDDCGVYLAPCIDALEEAAMAAEVASQLLLGACGVGEPVDERHAFSGDGVDPVMRVLSEVQRRAALGISTRAAAFQGGARGGAPSGARELLLFGERGAAPTSRRVSVTRDRERGGLWLRA